MATVINMRRNTEGTLPQWSALSKILPYKLYGEVRGGAYPNGLPEEIRCRKNRHAYVTVGGENRRLEYIVTDSDIKEITDTVFGGSLYAHKETVLEGFVPLEAGIRIGICGRAATEQGRVIGVYDISDLNIRLPTCETDFGAELSKLIQGDWLKGMLIYSPPGVGKTTLLRRIARRISSGERPMRVCVIDTRGELCAALDGKGLSLDMLVGYPREKGIEIATRTMSAQLIICDEIGDVREAEAILAAQNCGVPLIASAHGSDIHSLLKRTGIRRLHDAGVFGTYVGISRKGSFEDFAYEITEWETANELL